LLDSSAKKLDSSNVRDAARSTLGTDPRRVASALLQGELVKALAGPEQVAILDRAQATMAVLEGHAEHVMDAAAADLGPEYGELRRRLDARREGRTGLEAIIGRLLGMEIKLRQYVLGKAFCDAVVAEAGVDGLNQVWASPEALPTLAELEKPAEWLRRVGPEGSAKAA
jgi:putative hydrolase